MKGDSEEMLEIGNGICRKIQAGRYKEIYEIYKERFREIRGRYMTIWRRYKKNWKEDYWNKLREPRAIHKDP
jgi:hypothetical protein